MLSQTRVLMEGSSSIHPYPTSSSNDHHVYETVPDNRNDEA